MFSGGQRQRIAVARALMLHPRLVVADEPVSALDVSIQAQVLNLLMDLQQEMGIAYLFISHNLQVVRHIADDGRGDVPGQDRRIRAEGAVFARPAHPYTARCWRARRSLDAATRRERRSHHARRCEPPSPLSPPSGCAFHTRCPYAIERCRVEVPALEPLGEVPGRHRAAEIASCGSRPRLSPPARGSAD